jgi:hypothetical protein
MVLALTLPLVSMGAQQSGATDSASQRGVEAGACYGFSFGKWTPPLDWQRAGHAPVADSLTKIHPAAGRDWAAPTPEPGATLLILYPSWWLAGVSIEFSGRAPAAGDTVSAKATALVADGRVTPPTAPARVWRVACRT